MKTDRYNPVPLDIEASHARWMKRPGYAAAYDALADEFAALAVLAADFDQATGNQTGGSLGNL